REFPLLVQGASAKGASAASLHLLWISCGTEDGLIASNRRLVAWIKSQNVPVMSIETPGMHTWMVWRNNLVHFAPLLFQSK
ncbi:MAG: esterase, partial [Acidobacteriaceae bacterium]